MQILQERDPGKLPWKALGVDLVLECSGLFTDRDKAATHLTAGAKKVLISAPAKGAESLFATGQPTALIPANITSFNASCAPTVSPQSRRCCMKFRRETRVNDYHPFYTNNAFSTSHTLTCVELSRSHVDDSYEYGRSTRGRRGAAYSKGNSMVWSAYRHRMCQW
jgi:hypothetical protein